MFIQPITYQISTEWAAQLAYLMNFQLSYPTLHIMYTHAVDRCKISLWWKLDNKPGSHPRNIEELPIAMIYLQKVYDPINQEVTFLGYDTQENILAIGYSMSYPN